jgi:hypothetical protein
MTTLAGLLKETRGVAIARVKCGRDTNLLGRNLQSVNGQTRPQVGYHPS